VDMPPSGTNVLPEACHSFGIAAVTFGREAIIGW
jgi:hypothetical protein